MGFPKILMLIGLGVFAIGLALNVFPNLFSWFGKLPGDIRIEQHNRFIFFPITSMLVISGVLSLLFNLLFKK